MSDTVYKNNYPSSFSPFIRAFFHPVMSEIKDQGQKIYFPKVNGVEKYMDERVKLELASGKYVQVVEQKALQQIDFLIRKAPRNEKLIGNGFVSISKVKVTTANELQKIILQVIGNLKQILNFENYKLALLIPIAIYSLLKIDNQESLLKDAVTCEASRAFENKIIVSLTRPGNTFGQLLWSPIEILGNESDSYFVPNFSLCVLNPVLGVIEFSY